MEKKYIIILSTLTVISLIFIALFEFGLLSIFNQDVATLYNSYSIDLNSKTLIFKDTCSGSNFNCAIRGNSFKQIHALNFLDNDLPTDNFNFNILSSIYTNNSLCYIEGQVTGLSSDSTYMKEDRTSPYSQYYKYEGITKTNDVQLSRGMMTQVYCDVGDAKLDLLSKLPKTFVRADGETRNVAGIRIDGIVKFDFTEMPLEPPKPELKGFILWLSNIFEWIKGLFGIN